MGSIRVLAGAFFSIFFLFPLFTLPGQTNVSVVSLSSEIFRLETLASGAAVGAVVPSPRDRFNAFLTLAHLHKLSGNHQAALRAYEGALSLFPNDGRALLEQGRFLISIGEYERATVVINSLPRGGEFELAGRYLGAKLVAFRSGYTRHLSALADDPDFAQYRSGIYYTLWRLTGLDSYQTRLIAEFPRSPEAGIAGGRVNPAATPLWLLFPGRDSVVFSPAPPSLAITAPAPAPATPAPPAPALAAAAAGSAETAATGSFLQAGLFSQEANAVSFAQRIRSAGFEPRIIPRQVNGRDHWAVGVNGGSDTNIMIRRLRDAGFESFPVQ